MHIIQSYIPDAYQKNIKELVRICLYKMGKQNIVEKHGICVFILQLQDIEFIYIYLKPKWPLFWLEKTLFWRVQPPK